MAARVRFCDLNPRFGVDVRSYVCGISRIVIETIRHYCEINVGKNPKKYTDTIFLPATKFPLRLGSSKRIELDNFVLDKCKFSSLYKWQREHVNGSEFILHDGPPYANGKAHMGHAVNKILKDVTNRFKLLQGHKVHYVPGWDCHGLPIELKAVTESEKRFMTLPPVEIRRRAREFAETAISNQKTSFRSWGVMADWDQCYHTFDLPYIKNQFSQFFRMYNMGLIYRDVKPVFWSPSSRSALAEAELEYNPKHCSTAITVRLPMAIIPNTISALIPSNFRFVYALIWTTTPWTLPASQAICFNANMSYCLATIKSHNEIVYILASDQVDMVQNKVGRRFEIVTEFPGRALDGAFYVHPLDSQLILPFVAAHHVTTGKGTGLVHMAPAHGTDDFLVALKRGMPVKCVVDESGCYTADVVRPDLHGLSVLSSGSKEVLSILQADILHTEAYEHSYPYDWRTKEPVILRASQQWFIDTKSIKSAAIEKLQDVQFFPKSGSGSGTISVLASQLERRPYWCISRQRVWGVPIPVLFNNKSQEPIISHALIEHYCSLLDQHGPDFWWTQRMDILAPNSLLAASGLDVTAVEKGKDILDIWFDSGISWSSVLSKDKIADLYLEGIDQFTGWFQSSLMTSVALRKQSPFRSVYVHGFAVDEKGMKMSKSVGNVVDPQEITHGGKFLEARPAFGVDTLRWWVACHGTWHSSIVVSPNILQASADAVHKIRSVLRFLLGALQDYRVLDETEDGFYMLDYYIMHRLQIFDMQVQLMYNSYQYHHVCKHIINFVTKEVSALYCHLTKDRLYCEAREAACRRACQTVMKHILNTVTGAIAPVLPILAEEVYMHHPCNVGKKLLFFSVMQRTSEKWNRPEVEENMNLALDVKHIINKTSPVTNTWELEAILFATGDSLQTLELLSSRGELSELLQVSSVHVQKERDGAGQGIQVQLLSARGHKCARCRRWTSNIREQLCARCQYVLSTLPI